METEEVEEVEVVWRRGRRRRWRWCGGGVAHLALDGLLLLALLVQRVLRRLQRLVSPLHAEQRALPLRQKLLLLVVDRLHLLPRVAQRLVGGTRLTALRDELRLVQRELLLAALELLVELVDHLVLKPLAALELRDRLLRLVRRASVQGGREV